MNLLRTFLAVHRLGSFTAAARRLGLSQSTVTTQIRALEKRLGRELFERRAHGVAPLPHADELATQLSAPLDRLAAITGEEPGDTVAPVHLAGPAEFLSEVGLKALAPLVEQGVRLRVAVGLTEPLLEELRAGRHDLVVATRRPRGRTLHAELLEDEEFVLVAAPVWAERLKGQEGQERQEGQEGQELRAALEGLPLIAYADDLPIVRRYWRHVFDRRLHAEAAITFPDLRGVLTAVLAGVGWSVLPSYLCRSDLASGALRLLHRPEDPPINPSFLVQRPGSSINPHVTVVRERLLAAAKNW
ncbi:LysR family transcriptional regulator [Streptomyces sp. NPDC059010]|uniref:LysR family transcriptional regulator n=1 Tax=Streptomyces sp. NPDC059010 TaxID=3346695 RepID=UPI00369AB67D